MAPLARRSDAGAVRDRRRLRHLQGEPGPGLGAAAADLRRSRREDEEERVGPAAGITGNHGGGEMRAREGVRAPASRAAPRGASRTGGGSREAAL